MASTVSSAERVTVYRPNQRHEYGFFQSWMVMFRNVVQWRDLIWQLFKRDFLANYKKSFIGFTWLFLAPLAAIVPWVFLKVTGILQTGNMPIDYKAYMLVGTSMWGLFMGFYISASNTLSAGRSYIMQVYYPHEAVLFQQVGQHLARFSLVLVVNLLALLAFKAPISWKIVFLPVVALPLFFLGAGVGLLFSMFAIVAVDLTKAANATLRLLMFASPIIYARSIDNPLLRAVNKWNPLTYLVCSARDIIIEGRLYDTRGYFLCAAGALLVFLVSWRLFYLAEDKIIERIL